VHAEEFGRLAYETKAINRAMRYGVVLFGVVTADGPLTFEWRTASGRIGPRFGDRGCSIDLIGELLSHTPDR
jgi:hypothetical protein